MNRPSATPCWRPALAGMAGLLCAAILLCGTLAANGSWHQWFHSHDDDGGGEHAGFCAVCLFASGGCDQPLSPSAPAAVPVARMLDLPAPSSPVLSTAYRQDFQSRGPPPRHA